MAKKRLTVANREEMLRFAVSRVQVDPKLVKKRDTALTKAQAEVTKQLAKKWPASDLDVLRKYNHTEKTKHIKLKLSEKSSELDRVTLEDEMEVPESDGWGGDVYYLGDKAGTLVHDWRKAAREHDKAVADIRQDFNALLASSRTFEDAVESWEPFKEMTSDICGTSTAISLLSEDALARIQGYKVEKKNA